MPGTLPANSGYTYAAEFSVDEALKAGATQVNFDQPLINYTENFIGAPVGSPVPTGYYDRETRRVEGVQERPRHQGPRGRRRRAVDTDGDGKADTGLGMTDAERAPPRPALPARPGAVARRDHPLHAVGPQLALRPAARRQAARSSRSSSGAGPNDPCQQQGSAIGCETQTLGESVPLTGTGMTLDYATERTPGWRVDETLKIPITGGTLPPRLKGIQLTIDVAGEKIEKRWCDPNFPTTGASTCKDYPLITPNIDFSFRWDGLDAYDRAIQGRVTAKIKVIYVYEFNYYDATRGLRVAPSASSAPTPRSSTAASRAATAQRHDGHALLLRHPDRPDDHPRDRLLGRAPDRRPRRLDAVRPPCL